MTSRRRSRSSGNVGSGPGVSATFALPEIERQRGEDRVTGPARIAAPLEVIKAQLGLEVAMLHFDRPAAARDTDRCLEGGLGWQVAEIVLALVADQRCLTKQPALAATLRNVHSHGANVVYPPKKTAARQACTVVETQKVESCQKQSRPALSALERWNVDTFQTLVS